MSSIPKAFFEKLVNTVFFPSNAGLRRFGYALKFQVFLPNINFQIQQLFASVADVVFGFVTKIWFINGVDNVN